MKEKGKEKEKEKEKDKELAYDFCFNTAISGRVEANRVEAKVKMRAQKQERYTHDVLFQNFHLKDEVI